MVDPSMPAFTDANVPLEATNAPDRALVIGATGHVGRLFLEQGLELFPNTEFRVLLRDVEKCKGMPEGVDCREGDVLDAESIQRACDGFTRDSLIFDSVTQINLSPTDRDGSIAAINLEGVTNVVEVAKRLDLTLHKGHSNAGVPCPTVGMMTERQSAGELDEEPIYTTLPYLKAKRDASRVLLRAYEEGLRGFVSYLPLPIGPSSREDAVFNGLARTFAKTSRYFHPAGVDIAYVDARDAAKAHWLAYMRGLHGDFILSSNATKEDIMGSFAEVFSVSLRPWPLQKTTVVRLGKLMDFFKAWLSRNRELPLSEVTAKLMFANQRYSSAKAKEAFDFAPRPTRDSYRDHFQDLLNRGIVSASGSRRPISIW